MYDYYIFLYVYALCGHSVVFSLDKMDKNSFSFMCFRHPRFRPTDFFLTTFFFSKFCTPRHNYISQTNREFKQKQY